MIIKKSNSSKVRQAMFLSDNKLTGHEMLLLRGGSDDKDASGAMYDEPED